jgi:hypothetical protein
MVSFKDGSNVRSVDDSLNPTHIEITNNGQDSKDGAFVEADTLKAAEFLPKPEETIESLGISNWRELEKQVVRRLDMTLMPCLWVLYLFNYLDRASIA